LNNLEGQFCYRNWRLHKLQRVFPSDSWAYLFQDDPTSRRHSRHVTDIPDSMEDTDNSQTQFDVSVKEFHARGQSKGCFFNNDPSQS